MIKLSPGLGVCAAVGSLLSCGMGRILPIRPSDCTEGSGLDTPLTLVDDVRAFVQI